MGNAPSAPQRDETPTPAPHQQQQQQVDTTSSRQRPGLRRRISTFLRGSGSGSDPVNKRERSNSSQQSLALHKRRRVTAADEIDFEPHPHTQADLDPREPREDESMYSPPLTAGPSRGPSLAESVPQSMHTAHSQAPSRRDTLALPEEDSTPSPRAPASPATDELLSDRLRSISTIQDTLGDSLAPDWTPNVPQTAAQSLMARLRRREEPAPASPSGTEAGSPATPSSANRFAHRLSAIMGLATPDRRPSPGDRPRAPSAPEPAPVNPAPAAAEATQPPEEETGGIPVGAVLVIQGLAQTHAHPLEGSENDQHPPIDLASLDQQARMIGNLLTVAAAATATTLLSPESLNAQPSRSTAQSAMQTIIERLRPSRTRASQSVESALGEYLRSVLRDNRRFADAVTGETPPSANIPAEFQGFLHTLQEDLIQAVRAYAVPEGAPTAQAGEAGATEAAEAREETRAVAGEGEVERREDGDVSMPGAFGLATEPPSASPSSSLGAAASTAQAAAAVAAEPPAPSTEAAAGPSTEPAPATTPPQHSADGISPNGVPTFHHQPNQNLPMANLGRGLGVSGGTDGVPRRLNLFRAHLFPTVHENGSSATDTDEDAIVPSIFVGVRSIAHNPTLTTEDLVAHPSFPFMDGQVPEEGTTASGVSEGVTAAAPASATPSDDAHNFERDLERELAASTPTSASTPSSPPASAASRRSLRERVFERLGAAPARSTRSPLPMNTYLIYVIGGNYPRSHPVLAIPALVSGAPLTAEDLQLVSELLGPARPPTVTQEEIDAAGLAILRGEELRDAQAKNQVLESSVERCMVCLSDYEPADACRVLKCRHAFHTECVDQWLTTGRNSCPSCRTEAVDKDLPKPDPIPAPIPGVEDADAL